MHSKPIYYQEPYTKSLEATVVAITGQGVILDQTICYPEGGGQSGDKGTIAGCPLLDTTKDEDHSIYHHVKNPTFVVGDRVMIELDWNHRYHFMQMHTAQHVASGLLYSHFGIQTVSVHQGQRILTIETDAQEISLDTCHALEDLVNQEVLSSHAVHYELHRQDSAKNLGLRRSIKVADEEVRLVVVEDVDTVACGGLHVANTREIELFHYQGQEKIRGHIRLIFTVGSIAKEEIRRAEAAASALGVLFSSPLESLVEVATQSIEQATSDKAQLLNAKTEIARLLLASRVKQATQIDTIPLVLWNIEEDVDLKSLATAIADYEHLALCAIKEDGQRLLWLIALCGKASSLVDFHAGKRDLLALIDGKGGGKPPLYQGVGKGDGKAFLSAFEALFL